MDYISMKKHQHPRTEEDGDQDNTELARKNKSKMNNSETEADSPSSDHSCFVALVTASNLQEDALYLPKDFISSNGLKRKCHKIVLTDGGERSWALDMRFNKSSDTFYITQGWRNFCEENGKKAGSFFMFKLMKNREMPLLSFCPAESRGEKASKKESLLVEPSSGKQISKEATSPSQNRFVTLTVTHDSLKRGRLNLPLPFMRENGLDKPGMITLLGKDGTKWLANLRPEATGTMNFGKGWKDFAKANNFKTGESFTLESIWKDKTPMLSLLHTDPSNDGREQGECCSKASEKECFSTEPNSGDMTKKAKNNIEVRSLREGLGNKCLPDRRDSLSPVQNRSVTLTLTHDSLRTSRLYLPLPFMRENGLDKARLITLLGKDGGKWVANLRREYTSWSQSGKARKVLLKQIILGKGWKGFAKANGLKTGESVTLESIWKDKTPMLALLHTDPSIDRRQQGECCSKASEKESVSTELTSGDKTRKAKNTKEVRSVRELLQNKCLPNRRDSLSPVQNRFVTLTLVPEDVKTCKLHLPSQFMRDNGIDKLGKITLLGKERMKCSAYLLSRDGFVALGMGWKGFCEANGVKTGESFTLEFINEQYKTTPVLKFCSNCED